MALELLHRQNNDTDCLSEPFPMRYGPVLVVRVCAHTMTHSDFATSCYLVMPKVAENVPEMCRRGRKWIKLVELIKKVVLDAQNA